MVPLIINNLLVQKEEEENKTEVTKTNKLKTDRLKEIISILHL
jgi:hypothetical protein